VSIIVIGVIRTKSLAVAAFVVALNACSGSAKVAATTTASTAPPTSAAVKTTLATVAPTTAATATFATTVAPATSQSTTTVLSPVDDTDASPRRDRRHG
jgi:hypothetical protein